jgi:tetratricopeptide (TPR) repeat protein
MQPGGVVAANELRIPSKALKELERSQKAYLAGDMRSSVQHLEKAVFIHPPFLQAHNVLGARYLQLGDYERGLNEFHRAVDIDPKFAYGYHNLGVTAYFLHRYAEAEAAARLALQLDPQQATTRYLLGGILFAEQKNIPEAAELFRQSVEKFPNARLYLARIAQKNGDANGAVAELQTYLNVPEVDNRQKAACWLAQLTHSAASPGCSPEKPIP